MSSSRHRLGEVRTTEDGRLTLRFERRFAHPPGKVWRAITEASHLQAWGFPADVELDLTPGARLLFRPTAEQRRRFGMTQDQVTEGRMISAEPPRLLEYTWGEELLRFELAPAGDDGCQMIFTNVTAERDIAVEAAAGWHAGLEVLEAHLDGLAITWDAFERAGELIDDYAGVG